MIENEEKTLFKKHLLKLIRKDIKPNDQYQENFEQFYVDWKQVETKFFQNERTPQRQEIWESFGVP